jgi:hypothetical protein
MDTKTKLLADITDFYNQHKTEDGIHPGIGWEYCEEDRSLYGLEQGAFNDCIAELIQEGSLSGESEECEGGIIWHRLIPVQ